MEICDGKDNDCNDTVDEGFDIGTACIAGTKGVCRRNGTWQCASATTRACQPGAGTPSGEKLAASTDPYIYKGDDGATYAAAWDWDCNGTIDARPDTIAEYVFVNNATAAGYLCSGNLVEACKLMGPTQASCRAIAYPCGLGCGNFCSKLQSCGRLVRVAVCGWDGVSCAPFNDVQVSMYCK